MIGFWTEYRNSCSAEAARLRNELAEMERGIAYTARRGPGDTEWTDTTESGKVQIRDTITMLEGVIAKIDEDHLA